MPIVSATGRESTDRVLGRLGSPAHSGGMTTDATPAPSTIGSNSVGSRFVTAIAQRDEEALRSLLAHNVDFKGVTPKKFWEGANPDEVLDAVLGHWFEESDHIDEIVQTDHGDDVGDIKRIGYRFRITNPDGLHLVEQQAYYYEYDDKILYLRVVCSGYRPVS